MYVHVHIHVHVCVPHSLFHRVAHEQLQHSLTQEQENSQKLQHQLEEVIGRMETQAAEMQRASTTTDVQVHACACLENTYKYLLNKTCQNTMYVDRWVTLKYM